MHLRSLAAVVLVALLAACGAAGVSRPAGGAGAVAPAAAVERFLQLAGDRQYLEMGWVFGTAEGPIVERDPAGDVERRMYALATVLQHDSYVVGQGTQVPGRTGGAVSFRATLRNGARSFEVPLVAVRGPGDRWFVESVDVQAVTNVR